MKNINLICNNVARDHRVGFFLIAFLYVCVFPYQPELNNPNENVRLYMTAAIIEDGTYCIDGVIKRWGYVGDTAVFEGRHFSLKAPGASWLALPGYFLYRLSNTLTGSSPDRAKALWATRLSGAIVPCLLLSFFAFNILSQRYPSYLLRPIWVGWMLGSILYGYGITLVGHATQAWFAFISFLLLRNRPSLARTYILSGLAAGMATLLDYSNAVIACLLFLDACWRATSWKNRSAWVVGATLPAIALLHFHTSAFGDPLQPGYPFAEQPAYSAVHRQGLFGLTGFHPSALPTLLFSPTDGLLTTMPFLIFGIFGVGNAFRSKQRDALYATASSVGILLFDACLENWRGGVEAWNIGPRFLGVMVLYLGWLALEGSHSLKSRLLRPTWVGTMIVSVAIMGLYSAWYPHMPPVFDRPMIDVMAPMLRHHFAPYNLGMLFGFTPWAGMVLWLSALALIIAWSIATSSPYRYHLKDASVGMALVLCLCIYSLQWTPSGPQSSAERDAKQHALDHVLNTYRPRPRSRLNGL